MKKLLFFLLILMGTSVLAQQQVLDPSFAQGGVLTKQNGTVDDIFCLSNGKFIVNCGYEENGIPIWFAGFDPDGNYNTYFGSNGIVISVDTFFSTSKNCIKANGSIYIPKSSPQVYWYVAKYDTLGKRQLDFGKDGRIVGKGMQRLNAFTIDSQDRLIVGSTVSTNYGQGTQLIRFWSNGDFDSSFGNNGFSTIVTENYGAGTVGLHLLADGRIVAGEKGGGGAGTWMSVRFMPNGGPDTSYGDSGKVILPFPGYYLRSTIVQPDKKVLQCGDNDSLLVIRLKENGDFDSTFGTNGRVRYQQATMRTMLLMDNGRILLGGDTEDSMFAIYRLMPNGKLDTSFGVGGIVRIKLRPGGEHQMNDLAIQADGKLLAGGYTSNGLPYPSRMFYFTLACFMPDGRLDVGFVPPVSPSASLQLYPNPTEKTLLLQKTEVYAGKVQLQIVDMTGRVVLVREYEQMGTQPVQIEVGNLLPGGYQIILRAENGKTWNAPFIKR